MRDALEGWFIPVDKLKACIEQVKHKYTPTHLILSQDNFTRFLNLVTAHRNSGFLKEYRDLGIQKIVWSEDFTDDEFYLSSGLGIDPSVETIHLMP